MKLSILLLLAASLAGQTLAVDRPIIGKPGGVRVERAKGFFGDSFQIGAAGETWMIDRICLWGIPSDAPSCPRELGDSIEKLSLMGALDNPPVPGQPVCDCHALVTIASVPLIAGSSRSANPAVKLSVENGIWIADFEDVRWSVPGGADVLFSLRASPRRKDACDAGGNWRMATRPAAEGHALHLLDRNGVPEGTAKPDQPPRAIAIQVWAHPAK